MLCATCADPARTFAPSGGGRVGRLPQGLVDSRLPLAQMVARRPEVRERAHEPKLQLQGAGIAAPVECCPEVALLGLEPLPRLPGVTRRVLVLDGLREEGVVLGVAAAPRIALTAPRQQLERKFADGLQHEVPRRSAPVGALVDEARSDERRQRFAAGSAYGGGARARESPGEHGKAREERLRFGSEQPVAPVDRRAQRALARRQVARSLAGERERPRYGVEQLLWGVVARPRRGKLDRER